MSDISGQELLHRLRTPGLRLGKCLGRVQRLCLPPCEAGGGNSGSCGAKLSLSQVGQQILPSMGEEHDTIRDTERRHLPLHRRHSRPEWHPFHR